MSSYHLGRSIDDAPASMRSGLLITQAQIRTRALDYADPSTSEESLREQIRTSLAQSSKALSDVTDEKTRRSLRKKIAAFG